MQSLDKIKNKKILFVCAHPDDETLWAFQTLQCLKINNQLIILCMTYSENSDRGLELLALASQYDLKIKFGNCEDTGIDRLLIDSQMRLALGHIFSGFQFDLVLTHPPHGGEKPHPHHIQIYKSVKRWSKTDSRHFGFFSERKIMSSFGSDNKYTFKDKLYLFRQIIRSVCLMKKSPLNSKWKFFYSLFYDILLDTQIYKGFETAVNTFEKKKALSNFESQLSFLNEYSSASSEFEYLYIENAPLSFASTQC